MMIAFQYWTSDAASDAPLLPSVSPTTDITDISLDHNDNDVRLRECFGKLNFIAVVMF